MITRYCFFFFFSFQLTEHETSVSLFFHSLCYTPQMSSKWLYLPDRNKRKIHKVETYFMIEQRSLGTLTTHKIAFLIANSNFRYIVKILQNLSSPFQRNPILSFSISPTQRFMPQFLSSFLKCLSNKRFIVLGGRPVTSGNSRDTIIKMQFYLTIR